MEAKIKAQHRKKFVPFFQTAIMGQTAKISLQEAEKNPEKYINTPIGPLYKDYKKLKKTIKSRTKKAKVEVLDMRQAKRGAVFAKGYKNPKQKHIEAFLDKQKKTTGKIAARHEAEVEKAAQLEKDKQKAIDKAIADANKKPASTTKNKTKAAASKEEAPAEEK